MELKFPPKDLPFHTKISGNYIFFHAFWCDCGESYPWCQPLFHTGSSAAMICESMALIQPRAEVPASLLCKMLILQLIPWEYSPFKSSLSALLEPGQAEPRLAKALERVPSNFTDRNSCLWKDIPLKIYASLRASPFLKNPLQELMSPLILPGAHKCQLPQ